MQVDKNCFVKLKWFNWYYASPLWEIIGKRWKVLKQVVTNNWYCIVTLHDNWKQYIRYVHRLVAETFIRNPDNKEEINHKDWNKQNNSVSNLERCTRNENQAHKYKVLWYKPSVHWEKAVKCCDLDWNTIQLFRSISEASRFTWVDISQISWCCIWRKKYNTAWWYRRCFTSKCK